MVMKLQNAIAELPILANHEKWWRGMSVLRKHDYLSNTQQDTFNTHKKHGRTSRAGIIYMEKIS